MLRCMLGSVKISITTVAALQVGELNDIDCICIDHDVNRILNIFTNKPIHTNIIKSEHLALENLRKDKDCLIVIADKGVALVVIDKTEYITKCEFLLPDNFVYQHLSENTSPTIHKELIIILLDYKNNSFISETEYTQLSPHGSNSTAARFYGLPKIHKNNMPMCSIVSDCGTATYNTAKFITKILQNYCSKTSPFVKDSTNFIKKIKHLSFFKGTSTIKSLLMHPKDPIPDAQKTDIIYHWKCPADNCTAQYIDETIRSLKEFQTIEIKPPEPSETTTSPQNSKKQTQ